MDDTISRQTVLDAIDEISREVDDGYGFDYAKWREYFCELPPAQLGTNLAQLGTDCISRQAAIEALHMDTSIIPFEKAREYADATISEIRNRLEKLPSAEPKRAKWERHYSRPGVFADLCWHCSACGYKSSDGWANKFNFCPNCGAKMEATT